MMVIQCLLRSEAAQNIRGTLSSWSGQHNRSSPISAIFVPLKLRFWHFDACQANAPRGDGQTCYRASSEPQNCIKNSQKMTIPTMLWQLQLEPKTCSPPKVPGPCFSLARTGVTSPPLTGSPHATTEPSRRTWITSSQQMQTFQKKHVIMVGVSEKPESLFEYRWLARASGES